MLSVRSIPIDSGQLATQVLFILGIVHSLEAADVVDGRRSRLGRWSSLFDVEDVGERLGESFGSGILRHPFMLKSILVSFGQKAKRTLRESLTTRSNSSLKSFELMMASTLFLLSISRTSWSISTGRRRDGSTSSSLSLLAWPFNGDVSVAMVDKVLRVPPPKMSRSSSARRRQLLQKPWCESASTCPWPSSIRFIPKQLRCKRRRLHNDTASSLLLLSKSKPSPTLFLLALCSHSLSLLLCLSFPLNDAPWIALFKKTPAESPIDPIPAAANVKTSGLEKGPQKKTKVNKDEPLLMEDFSVE